MIQRCLKWKVVLAFCWAFGVVPSPSAAASSNNQFEALRSQLLADPAKALANARSAEAVLPDPHTPGDRQPIRDDLRWVQAAALLSLNRPAEAMEVARKTLDPGQGKREASEVRAKLLLARGDAYAALNRVQDALGDYQEAYTVSRRIGSTRDQAVALLYISAMYSEARDYAGALKYIRQSLETYSADPVLALSAHNNAAVAFHELHRLESAETEYRRSLGIARSLHNQLMEVQVLRSLAGTQLERGLLDDARRTLDRAFQMARSGPAAAWYPALLGRAAEIELEHGRLAPARSLIEQALHEAGSRQAVLPVQQFHDIAFQIYKRSGNPAAALHHLEQAKRLDDQARSLAASTGAALMSARFDFANQDLKITRLRQARAEQDAALARTRARYHLILAGGVLAAALAISALLSVALLSIRRSRNQVRAANATLTVTNAELERALAARTEFLATTSHEIRTPLNGILGMTQVLLADRTVAPAVRGRVELIHGAGETMRALVDDILDVAKMETGELRVHAEPMDLHRLLRDAAAMWAGQAETKGLSLALDLGDTPAGIVADEVRLRQVVFNLMANAVKFTDRGGVRLIARTQAADGAERLALRVEDTGIGIPADRLRDIFEPFRQVDGGTTRRHGGTGLGLAICRNLARAMGGDVDVASVSGAGSAFTLALPLVRAALPAAAPARDAGPATLRDARLLVLEPNPLAQGVLRAVLTPHVRALELVGDAAAAAAALERGGADHLLADAAAFGLRAEEAARFLDGAPGVRATLLWPAPDEAVLAALAAHGAQVVAKPLAAPDLLGRLAMGYGTPVAQRDLAA